MKIGPQPLLEGKGESGLRINYSVGIQRRTMPNLFNRKSEDQNLAWNTSKFKVNERLDEMELVITSIYDRLNKLIVEVEADREYRALRWWQRFWIWLSKKVA